jgi:hypothetical protein
LSDGNQIEEEKVESFDFSDIDHDIESCEKESGLRAQIHEECTRPRMGKDVNKEPTIS